MNNKRYFVFTHYDFDGAASYMLVNWTFSPNTPIPYCTTTARRFREDFTKWMINNSIEDFDTVFIMDLDVGDHKDLIDKKNVIIIDHHATHEHKADYMNATAVVKEYKSAAELGYKAFTKIYNTQYTESQKMLILFASDYDSYTLQLKESTDLNTLLWGTSFKDFVADFANGYHKLNVKQESIIKFFYEKIEQLKSSLQVYTGKFNIQGKERSVYATFADKWINEVADHLLLDFKADVAIVVNTKSQHVSIRRHKDTEDLDVAVLAKKLIGENAGGHPFSAAGELSETFMNFTRLLKQIK